MINKVLKISENRWCLSKNAPVDKDFFFPSEEDAAKALDIAENAYRKGWNDKTDQISKRLL